MGITVQNITATSATVMWPASPSCVDSFYSIMYHPNWNNLLTGYSRKNFLKEDKVPTEQTSTSLWNLSPQTSYILCVTCQSANPSGDQCRVFSTLGQDPSSSLGSGRKELAMGIWLTSSLLLLIIAGILLYGCLHIWCGKQQDNPEGTFAGPDLPDKREAAADSLYTHDNTGEDAQTATIIENPFTSSESSPRSDRNRELVPLACKHMDTPSQSL
ncbi:FNDC9 protein, partial [Polyodon spathula]|nr:fibronectin type III domain-containing protein 9-like [Polyodon spathula]MBN3272461.1 FNDC9 protein [Polyodon spathula]